MRDYSELTYDQLLMHKRKLELECEHWKSCKDGSHGLALHSCGYYDVLDEINKRKTEYANR